MARRAMVGWVMVGVACVAMKWGRASEAGEGGMSVDSNIVERIDRILAWAIAADGPGAAVLVRQDGRELFSRGYGVCDLSGKRAIDAETNFRLASCSKQFTAMAIMLLVHDGRLRYDETLAELFPDFPAYGKGITIRHLLNHVSGLPDYESLMEQRERNGSARWTEQNQIQDAEVLALLKQTSSPVFSPGTKWAYSNSGYVMLGLIVARVSGKPFGEFLRERIFAPLQMTGTIAYERGKNEVANRAYGHSREGETWKQTDQSSTSATLGDGGVYSSLADLAKWDEELTHHTLLSESEMQVALVPAKLASGAEPKWPRDSDRPEGTSVAYGFGWFLDPYLAHARMWHYGDTRGFHTYIERFIDDRVTIVVLCNRPDIDPEAMAEQIAAVILPPR